MKSFDRDKPLEYVEFTLDGDTFRAVGTAPATAILRVAAVNEAKDLGKIEIIMDFLDKVLEEESAVRFAQRLSSAENPVTIEQCASIAVWLMEEVYASERPTTDPSQSPNGSSNTGQSSTDGAQAEGSTPETSTRRVL